MHKGVNGVVMKVNALPLLTLATALLGLAGSAGAQSNASLKPPPVSSPTVRLLSPEVSRSLQIMRMPTRQPVPLLVGVYWRCQDNGIGSEFCLPITIVCTQDQSLCAEV
jgi:hypothetical protein